MPRFVILEHDHPIRHWDLMLEMGDVLRTWRLEKPPTDEAVVAEASFDHRLIYLEFEGPLSGNRGSVTCWDRGTYEIDLQSAESLIFTIAGRRLIGTIELIRVGEVQWFAHFRAKSP